MEHQLACQELKVHLTPTRLVMKSQNQRAMLTVNWPQLASSNLQDVFKLAHTMAAVYAKTSPFPGFTSLGMCILAINTEEEAAIRWDKDTEQLTPPTARAHQGSKAIQYGDKYSCYTHLTPSTGIITLIIRQILFQIN